MAISDVKITTETTNSDNSLGAMIGGQAVSNPETQLKAANTVGVENLAGKGVYVSSNATTYEIMEAINKIREGSGGGFIITITDINESTADGGENIVYFSDGSVLTVRNGSKGSQGVQGEKGEKGDTGSQGADGYTPVKGTDYFTEADKEEMVEDVAATVKNHSKLAGKKIVYDGDSLCAPWGSENGGAYPKIIANLVGGTYDNQAVGGGRFRTETGALNEDGTADTFHSIVDNLVNLPTDGDIYCFEGGVNDHWNKTILGDFVADDYTGELDTTTFCGALETVFRYCLNNFVGKAVCFIITHKCKYQGDYGNGDTFADFRDKMIGICEKYAIPYYDAWAESGLNYWNTAHLDNYFIIHGEGATTGDGTHPNTEGYKRYYVPQLISLFEKILPMGIENEDEDDGTTDTPSEEPDTPDTPSYVNALLTAEAADSTDPYNGVGYKADTRYSTSQNAEVTATGYYMSGYIPFTYNANQLVYFKNVNANKNDGMLHIHWFNGKGDYKGSASADVLTSSFYAVWDENGMLVSFKNDVNCPYFRVQCSGFDETSIISVGNPIT